MGVMTADANLVAAGNRAFNLHAWKWGVIVGNAGDSAEILHDDGTRTVVETRWVLSNDPSRLTW